VVRLDSTPGVGSTFTVELPFRQLGDNREQAQRETRVPV